MLDLHKVDVPYIQRRKNDVLKIHCWGLRLQLGRM